MKTFKLTVTEEELKALISHHAINMHTNFDTETSERIHTLTKRLNKDTPEIEGDPRPQETRQQEKIFVIDLDAETKASSQSAQEIASIEQVKIPEGW